MKLLLLLCMISTTYPSAIGKTYQYKIEERIDDYNRLIKQAQDLLALHKKLIEELEKSNDEDSKEELVTMIDALESC